MQLTGKLVEVGNASSGISKSTGKPWVCRTLSFLVPFYNVKGEEKFDNIVADFFGETSDEELKSYIAMQTTLTFNVAFSTREYNGRRYQEARVFNLAAKI